MPDRRRGSSLRLYVSQPVSVEIDLEGRLAPSTFVSVFEVEALLRQPDRRGFRQLLRVTKDWTRFRLPVARESLSVGKNTLRIISKQPTQWRNFRVSAVDRGRSFSQELPTTEVIGDELHLPFGQSVAYPVQLTSNTWLKLDGVQPWLGAGAPSLAPGSQLRVRICSGSSVVDRSWTLKGEGSKRLHLQTQVPASVELSLLAWTPTPPLPGQEGLRLVRPRVESWGSVSETQPEEVAPPLSNLTRRPNVVLYLIDTLRADHLGCYGYPEGTSPHIDRFRQDSVLFADCTAQSSWTKPATASILSSMLPRQHGAMDYADKLHPSSVLLSQVLHQSGYETRAVVTNPFACDLFGFNRGYDDFLYLKRANSREVNQAVLPWLKTRTDRKPFFLYLHTLDPHTPYGGKFSDRKCLRLQEAAIRRENDYRWKGRHEKKLQSELRAAIKAYDGQILANDASFGALLQALKESGQFDNTLIVLVSDHGEEFLDHGRMGHDNSLYQELLHVPLIMKFPASQAAGARITPCWQQIDIAPTILACVGIKAPTSMVGKAYLPGGSSGDRKRPAYISLRSKRATQPDGKFPRMIDMNAVRQDNWVFTHTLINADGRLEPRELYNLAEDPQEKENQAWNHPEVGVSLNDLLLRGTVPEAASAQIRREDVESAMRSLHYLR